MLRRIALYFLVIFLGLARSASSQTSSLIPDLLTVRPLDRVVAFVNDQQRVVLPGNRHPLTKLTTDLGAAPPDLRMDRMILLLRPDEQQQRSLNALSRAQQEPTSTYYHQWLTPESYSYYFGVSDSDQRRVESWLISHGLQVNDVFPGGQSILFSGTVEQVNEAFHTQIDTYQSGKELYYANATDLEIPAALSTIVDGVVSINNFPLQPLHTGLSPAPSDLSGGYIHALTPADFAVIYNLNPLYDSAINGAGVSIAVAGRTNIALADVRGFRRLHGLPAGEPEILIDGPDPGRIGLKEEAEAVLDLEWTGAVARNALIKLVVSESTNATDGIFLAVRYIVEHNLAPVMSVNFGFCEAGLGASANSFLQRLWQQAAVQGISVVVASGNSSSDSCGNPSTMKANAKGHVNGLSSTQYNTAVGGTEFDDEVNSSFYWSSNASSAQASALGYIPEEPWSERGATGLPLNGAGLSMLYAKPWWQTGTGAPGDKGRDVPDVALAAASYNGYQIYLNGIRWVVGGTSPASVSFAGVMALLVQDAGGRQGNAGPMLYALAQRQQLTGEAVPFHAIPTGSDSVLGVIEGRSAARYNLATGLGSVDAELLVERWSDLTRTSGADRSTFSSAFFQSNSSAATAAARGSLSTSSQPMIYYSTVSFGPATGSTDTYICVYGESFGETSHASRLAVDGVAVTSYSAWLDPGESYGPGRYAKACVNLGPFMPNATARVQLTTAQGTSNTSALATGQGPFGASGIGR